MPAGKPGTRHLINFRGTKDYAYVNQAGRAPTKANNYNHGPIWALCNPNTNGDNSIKFTTFYTITRAHVFSGFSFGGDFGTGTGIPLFYIRGITIPFINDQIHGAFQPIKPTFMPPYKYDGPCPPKKPINKEMTFAEFQAYYADLTKQGELVTTRQYNAPPE